MTVSKTDDLRTIMSAYISADKLADIQEATIATSSKYVFFFLGLNATVLGFLFTQAILGNLQGLGCMMVVAWIAFGICFIIGFLTAWAIYHTDNLSKLVLIKAKQYSDVVSNNREDLSMMHSREFSKIETIKTLKKDKNNDFLAAESELADASQKLIEGMQKWYLKYTYYTFITVHIFVYILSIYFGTSLINSESGTPLKVKPQLVEQSALEISLAPEVLQVVKNLSEKVAVPASSQNSLPAEDQPSLAH